VIFSSRLGLARLLRRSIVGNRITERNLVLQDVETLPHAARIQTMIELGRRSQTDPETAALLLQHPDKNIRFRIFQRYTSGYRQLTGTDSDHQVLPLLAHMVETAENEECLNAARTLFALSSPQDCNLICQVFRSTLTKLDLLEDMVNELNSRVERKNFLPVVRAVLDVLATVPVTTLLRLQLAISHLPADELFPFLSNLAAKNELHAEALANACTHIDRNLKRFDLPILERLETTFAASEDERLRRLALALLLEQAERANNWSPAYCNRLRLYCPDRSLMVATVAQFTFPE
jgi:hypothetical protein